MSEARVLIVGAGPTGLVLALWLARTGTPFRLIDGKSAPGAGSRAMAVQARTLEFYRQLGIAEQAVAAGFRLDMLHLRNASRELATVPLGDVGKGLSPYPFALSLPQDDHERLLIDCLRAAGHAVEWDTELIGLTQDEHGVQAALRRPGGEASWQGQYLCGCDGAHSAVRHSLGVGFPGGTYDQLFYVADAQAEGNWSERDMVGYLAEKTFCLAFPVRQRGMFRFIGLVPPELRERADITFDDLRAGVEQVTGTRVKDVNWFSTYRVHHRVADHFRQGRVFLAGDAGHVHSPAGGQGMNTGIGDAVNLAWKLAAVLGGHAAPKLLDSYEEDRLPFARFLVDTTDQVFEAVARAAASPDARARCSDSPALAAALRGRAAGTVPAHLANAHPLPQEPAERRLHRPGARRRPPALGRRRRQLRAASVAWLADPRLWPGHCGTPRVRNGCEAAPS